MNRTNLGITLLLALAALFLPGMSVSQTPSTFDPTKSGSMCVLPNSSERPTRISPRGDYNPGTLIERIDKQEPVHWPHKTPVLIQGLDLLSSHLVVLTSDGKPIQSVRFKFSDYHDAKLCISFDGYQGVQLGNHTDALWCKVKNRDCSR